LTKLVINGRNLNCTSLDGAISTSRIIDSAVLTNRPPYGLIVGRSRLRPVPDDAYNGQNGGSQVSGFGVQ
jgi:hypothetical protein